jgi:two-component sensor histidine kinase
LNHRTINEFASLISAVSLTIGRTKHDEVKAAVAGVAEVLHHHADIHHALQMPEPNARIDAEAHLRNLCLSISRAKLDRLKIELVLVASPLQLQSDHCWRLGMIVYELATNAARHAFAERHGEIRVELLRAGRYVTCKVLDNGSAAAGVQPGRGLKIVDELTKGLGGRFVQKLGSGGSTSIIAFPYSWECEEQQRQEPKRSGVGLTKDRPGPQEKPDAMARHSRPASSAVNAASAPRSGPNSRFTEAPG